MANQKAELSQVTMHSCPLQILFLLCQMLSMLAHVSGFMMRKLVFCQCLDLSFLYQAEIDDSRFYAEVHTASAGCCKMQKTKVIHLLAQL